MLIIGVGNANTAALEGFRLVIDTVCTVALLYGVAAVGAGGL
jgi:hypothetical protein